MTLRLFAGWAGLCLLGGTLIARAPQSEDGYNTNQRILKIRDLGKRGPTALPSLAPYLSDPNRDIRVEAVKSIVRIDTPASLDPLITAAHDSDSEVQVRATDGIVNAYVPGYVARSGLTGSLTRGMRQVKSFFASRNDQVVDPDVTIRPDVAQALTNQVASASSLDVRANAALACGILRNRAAGPALVEALRSKDNSLIFESLVALQKLRDPANGPGAALLANDLDERIQITALETIGVLRSLSSAPEVRSALKNARNQKVRRAALEALAMLGIPGDRATFQQYAEDSDAGVRAAALEGLGRIREPEDFPTLEKAFNEENADWRVHLAAAYGMVSEGKLGTSDFDPLMYLLQSLGNRNREDTAKAYLTELARREDVRKALESMVPDALKDEKLGLCEVFAATQDPGVIPVLNQLAKDIDPDVAFAATKALRVAQARNSPE
jgi:HEAT repeat protein